MRKVLEGLVSLVLVVVLGFLLFRLIPGDPIASLTRDRPTSPEQIAEMRRQLGVDNPMWRQFLDYVGGCCTATSGCPRRSAARSAK